MQDILALGFLGVLRIGVPALLIAGIGYMLVRYSKARISADIQAPAEAVGLSPAEWARAVTVPPVVPCWEQKNCDAAKRASCAAYKRSHVPCWLAVQVAEGQLRADCMSCDLYRLEKRDRPYLRVIKGRKADLVADETVASGERQGGQEAGVV